MLNWTKQFNIFCFLDNHNYNFTKPKFDWILAAGSVDRIVAPAGNALAEFEEFTALHKDWIFGHLSYDLMNELDKVETSLPDHIGFPDLHFFVPQILITCDRVTITIESFDDEQSDVFAQIQEMAAPEQKIQPITLKTRFSKQQYLDSVQKLKNHIHRGDCYEINFCQEFFAEKVNADPLSLYLNLQEISPNPFAAFYKCDNQYLLCASPERYIRRQDDQIISQPIKGTIPRDITDEENDERLKQMLFNSPKERSENVMVVDLVRNDLSRICKRATVQVEELFGIYKFPQVYQMISTISGKIDETTSPASVIAATFPMGSMTGAPKKRVMELIEQYELTKRGLFSGSVGYVDPAGDFDFNVVIRSIQYNAASNYLSFIVGSAITFYSDPVQEYDECLLKASAMMKVLGAEL